uniref:Uncharacterized protein n=1 Tax=Anopheles atroparvus TaxID=41427 RepID=A0A182INB2_ANOAO
MGSLIRNAFAFAASTFARRNRSPDEKKISLHHQHALLGYLVYGGVGNAVPLARRRLHLWCRFRRLPRIPDGALFFVLLVFRFRTFALLLLLLLLDVVEWAIDLVDRFALAVGVGRAE